MEQAEGSSLPRGLGLAPTFQAAHLQLPQYRPLAWGQRGRVYRGLNVDCPENIVCLPGVKPGAAGETTAAEVPFVNLAFVNLFYFPSSELGRAS